MPKPKSSKRAYDSDDGFVEDGRSSKKQKSEPKPRNPNMQKDKEGNEYWELTGKRRVQISNFKGNTMLGIREYYEKDGEMLPGKKGISMTIDQYTAFVELMPDIDRLLKKKGIKAPRPQYDSNKSSSPAVEDEEASAGEEEAEESEEEQPAKPSSKTKGKLDKFKMKPNHEATDSSDDG